METEIRYYYSLESEEKIINFLKKIKELKYEGKYYEETLQYNHPMKKYDFYSLDIDGRFRIRKTIGDKESRAMITWKRRLKDNKLKNIHQEEEVEVNINIEEYDNLTFLIENILHLKLVESYERYRSVFSDKEVEIVVDRFPFGIALEIESKDQSKPINVIEKWINKLGLNIKDSYKLSWDDKYQELCKKQNKKINNIVTFSKDMPKEKKEFKNELHDKEE